MYRNWHPCIFVVGVKIGTVSLEGNLVSIYHNFTYTYLWLSNFTSKNLPHRHTLYIYIYTHTHRYTLYIYIFFCRIVYCSKIIFFKIYLSKCCCCSVTQLCLTLSDPMDCSMPGFPVYQHLLEFAQTHVR